MKKILSYLLKRNTATAVVGKGSLSAHEVALRQISVRRRSGVPAGAPGGDVKTTDMAGVPGSGTSGERAVASVEKADEKADREVDRDKQARKERKRAARRTAARSARQHL